MMEWLSLPIIKHHLRIEQNDDSENVAITLYGESAEEFVLDYTCRTVDELKAMNTLHPGEIPKKVIQASLELVDLSYTHRSPADIQNLYMVPYSVDALLSYYRKGTYSSVQENINQ